MEYIKLVVAIVVLVVIVVKDIISSKNMKNAMYLWVKVGVLFSVDISVISYADKVMPVWGAIITTVVVVLISGIVGLLLWQHHASIEYSSSKK